MFLVYRAERCAALSSSQLSGLGLPVDHSDCCAPEGDRRLGTLAPLSPRASRSSRRWSCNVRP